MTTPTEPYLEAGGPDATGEIRWTSTEGLTFWMEIPHASDHRAAPQMNGAEPRPQPGQYSEIPDQPAWTGTAARASQMA